MKPTHFRASFTTLSLWASGSWDMAVEKYFKLKEFTTEAMADGKRYHEDWETEIKKTGCLPAVFGGKKLERPKTEMFKKVYINDWLELIGKVDLVDEPTVHEFKTGVQSSEHYANSVQTGIYGVLCTMDGFLLQNYKEIPVKGVFVDRAEIHHYNQHSKKVDMSFVWLTDKVLDDALDWVLTYSSEMHNYLVENGLYEKLAKTTMLKA